MSLLLGFILTFSGAVFAQKTPKLVPLKAEQVYVPRGFDHNDNAEIVLAATYPSLCYRTPQTEVVFDGNVIRINLTVLDYSNTGEICPQIARPLLEVVSLGFLEAGEYKIYVNSDFEEEIITKLTVNLSNSASADDHTYARVQYVEEIPGTNKVLLKGYNPSDCFQLDKITYVSNGKDTYSVLPILKNTYADNFCPRKMVPFNYEFTVPSELKTNEVLLHIRSMDKKSVNHVYKRN
ncbi:MAG: hypothetical protein JNM93_06735 [Bacteriovoracaceae bacterium]|nr:hypothetical protein [Bacteriovoracaceae bacterium]